MSTTRRTLGEAHRLVIKLGTHVVTTNGVELALPRLEGICRSIAKLRQSGREVVLVSSGAVGMGIRALGMKERPRSLGLRQACAAVGQGHLMSTYTGLFAKLGLTAAQVLLTQEDLGDRDRALCLRTTLMRLLELGTVPVLNENDSVSVRELVEHRRKEGVESGPPAFGDNDGLSAQVSVCIDADVLIMLTNVDGVFTASPAQDPDAKRIPEISVVDDEALARTAGFSSGGTGGMASKLEAARVAIAEGTSVVVANGGTPEIIDRVLAGEDLGTLIPATEKRRARWRHIAISARAQGALVVNTGALKALGQGKASLLPIGVVSVEGGFEKGDVVEIRDGSGRVHGRGLVNYDAEACRRLAGHKSDEIDTLLGYRSYDALITRDNLVMGAI